MPQHPNVSPSCLRLTHCSPALCTLPCPPVSWLSYHSALGTLRQRLVASLATLSAQLQDLFQFVYGREHPSDGREKKEGLTLPQLREGLRRTGFADAESSERIFYLLDTRNSGSGGRAKAAAVLSGRGSSSMVHGTYESPTQGCLAGHCQ
ncbi:unnamed protein product [Prorocentrum cordatum]|uniref:Uncharacterized protein n=1 Tax=Prorocentrum cordatum TaxID=2364126 RepID=A0ABN9X0R8_9DINO|nr:unnamed protein product [Polarella glacialis]